jgi:hypothetical protein
MSRKNYAPELVAGGFAIEIADAELLHAPLDLADLAHVLVLLRREVIPPAAGARLLDALLVLRATPVSEVGYDPARGEIYNCREDWLAHRIGRDAGWLHAGRPRREAVRIALRLRLRRDLVDVLEAAAAFVVAAGEQADRHAETFMAEQTYLQHAQPSTFARSRTRPCGTSSDWRRRWPGSTSPRAGPVASTEAVSPGTATSSPGCWVSTGSSSTRGTRCGRPMATSRCCPG